MYFPQNKRTCANAVLIGVFLTVSTCAQEQAQKAAVNGKVIDGVRTIRMEPPAIPNDIHVYSGEAVKLIADSLPADFSIHIPEFKISRQAEKGNRLEVEFKAEKTGAFDVFYKGDFLAGGGGKRGRVLVLEREPESAPQFFNISAQQAKKLLEEKKPLLLDVRTAPEFSSGHIEGAMHIPLSQLEYRLSEIEDYKDKEVLVYCRSGNRSVAASQILLRNGFKKISNLKRGLIGWKRSGY